MSQVKRLYVEKKPSYAVKAKELAEELKAYLSIDDVSNVRVLIRYDVENVSFIIISCSFILITSFLSFYYSITI